MTIILDIKENSQVPAFMEHLKGLDYVNILKEGNRTFDQIADIVGTTVEFVKSVQQGISDK